MTDPYSCPSCSATLSANQPACPHCGMRLSGAEYERLWYVLTQIRTLQVEADRLKRSLQAPRPEAGQPPTAVPVPAAKAGPSGQQVLLGLGALLVLAASSIFLLAVWFLVGVYGQALIMAGLTGLAVQGGRLAARRGLTAASETGAVIATGMALLDALGARRFGLFGLDTLSPEAFGTLASLVVGALLLGFDRLAPHAARDGSAARQPVVYRPAAALLLVAAPWFALAWVGPTGLAMVVAVLVVAFVHAATAALFAYLYDRHTPPVYGLGVAAGGAYVLHVLGAFLLAHDVSHPFLERYGALALLLAPVAALLHPKAREVAARPAVLAYLLVLVTVPLADLRGPAVLVLAVVIAAVLAVLVTRDDGDLRVGANVLLWMTAGTGLVLSLMTRASEVSLHRDDLTGTPDGSALGVLVGTLPMALLLVIGGWAAVRARRSRTGAVWAVQAQVALALGAARLLLETDGPGSWWTTAAALLVAEGVLAGFAARRGDVGLEAGAVGFGLAYASTALAAAGDISELRLAGTFFLLGAVLIGWATSPGRFLVAYLAVAANALGDWVLTERAGVEVVEAYSLPVAAMLAVVGFLHWRRDRNLPSLLTMGPALGVALMPSLLVAVDEGSVPRLVGVTTAGVVVLLVGYAQEWKAPVAWGALTLGVIGLTQGGPYVAEIPGWITLGLGGAVLLALGVQWEAATNAGRRGAAWFGSLA